MSVRHWNARGRAAVALHCSLAHAGAWSGLAAALPDWAITAPDLPGHGRAADLAPGQDLHDIATEIGLSAMRAAGEAVDLIGHSFGATVALRLALTHPARVRRLVLIEPVLFAAAQGTAEFDDFAKGYTAVAAAQGDAMQAAALFHAVWGHGDFAELPSLQRHYMASRMPLVWAQNPVLLEDREGLLAPGRLEALDLPVLLLEGAKSPPVIGAIQARLASRLPQVRRAVVPEAAHMLPITHAAQVAAEIQSGKP